MASGRKPRFVPQIIFASTVAGVAPACGDDMPPIGRGQVIALAVAGFTGCPTRVVRDAGGDAAAAGGAGGASNPCASGGGLSFPTGGQTSTGGRIIVLAVKGFSGNGSQ